MTLGEKIINGELSDLEVIELIKELPRDLIRERMNSLRAEWIAISLTESSQRTNKARVLLETADFIEAALLKPSDTATAQPQGNQPPASQEPATGRELPSELDTEQARKYFARAVAAGWMSEQFDWLGTKSQLGYFCYKTYSRPRPLTALERFFDVKKLSSDITNASIPAKRADLKKWRAKQDKEIFFD